MPKTLLPRRCLPALLPLLLATATVHAASPEPVDAGWILSKLAQPAPASTEFLELRGSRLLKKPLRVEGRYERPDEATLVRTVRAPYVETSTIRDGSVTIERAGSQPRRYALDRAPELAGLQASFGALLAGDRARLEALFGLAADGNSERWTLTLTPRQRAMATRVRGIVLHGHGGELRCIETRPAQGDVQRTLLAGAARAAAGVTDAAGLAALCSGDSAAK